MINRISGHVESGNGGGETESELGSTLLGGSWGLAGEDVLTIVLNGGGTGSVTAGSGGITLSWGEVSTAGTFLSADIGGIIISADNLSGNGSEKSNSGEFHF